MRGEILGEPLSLQDNGGPRWPRRLFHALGGSAIPIAAIFFPVPLIIAATGVLAAGSLALDLMRFRIPLLNRLFVHWLRLLLKREEAGRVTGATYLLIAACLCFLVFDEPVAIAVLLFLALGDPVAALVGRRMPGVRFFGKSPIGTLAFIGMSMLVMWVLVTAGVAELQWALLAAAVVAGLVELAPIPLDDNLTVPLISGAVAQYLPPLIATVVAT